MTFQELPSFTLFRFAAQPNRIFCKTWAQSADVQLSRLNDTAPWCVCTGITQPVQFPPWAEITPVSISIFDLPLTECSSRSS